MSLDVFADAKPVQLPTEHFTSAKKELDELEQEDTTRFCPETMEWVHNLITVVKKNETLRLCLDLRNLNKDLIKI